MEKAEINLKNVIAYIQGNLRYFLYYGRFNFLIRKFIREQIKFRISSMRQTCFAAGECELCGCKTTHLQMANKVCGGNCYPPMIKYKYWKKLKKRSEMNEGIVKYQNKTTLWEIDFRYGKFIYNGEKS